MQAPYGSQFLDPFVAPAGEWSPRYGALTYTVPGGWVNRSDFPGEFVLTPSGAPDGTQLAVVNDIVVSNRADNCSEDQDPDAGTTADGDRRRASATRGDGFDPGAGDDRWSQRLPCRPRPRRGLDDVLLVVGGTAVRDALRRSGSGGRPCLGTRCRCPHANLSPGSSTRIARSSSTSRRRPKRSTPSFVDEAIAGRRVLRLHPLTAAHFQARRRRSPPRRRIMLSGTGRRSRASSARRGSFTRALMRPARNRLLALSLAAVLLGACGANDASLAPTPAPTPPDGVEFLLRLETEQAVPPLARFGETPPFVVTLDGRVLDGRRRSGDLPGAARRTDRPTAAHARRLDEDRRRGAGQRPARRRAADRRRGARRDGDPCPDRRGWVAARHHRVQPLGGMPLPTVPGTTGDARGVPGMGQQAVRPVVARRRDRSRGALPPGRLRRRDRPDPRRRGHGATHRSPGRSMPASTSSGRHSPTDPDSAAAPSPATRPRPSVRRSTWRRRSRRGAIRSMARSTG